MARRRHGSSRPSHRDPGRAQRHRTADQVNRSLRKFRNSIGVARNVLRPGAIVHARVPFAERCESKVRPVIVVATNASMVLVQPISTSAQMRRRAGFVREIELNHRRCWVLDRLMQIPHGSIVGLISAADGRYVRDN